MNEITGQRDAFPSGRTTRRRRDHIIYTFRRRVMFCDRKFVSMYRNGRAWTFRTSKAPKHFTRLGSLARKCGGALRQVNTYSSSTLIDPVIRWEFVGAVVTRTARSVYRGLYINTGFSKVSQTIGTREEHRCYFLTEKKKGRSVRNNSRFRHTRSIFLKADRFSRIKIILIFN